MSMQDKDKNEAKEMAEMARVNYALRQQIAELERVAQQNKAERNSHITTLIQDGLALMQGKESSPKVNGAIDVVNHPLHYTQHPSGVECIEVAEHFGYRKGNAIKYIWRAGMKGNAIEDLEKAIFYLNREIEQLKGQEQAKCKHQLNLNLE